MSFTLIGSVEFISEEEYNKQGFSKPIETHPALLYTNTTNEGWEKFKYYKNGDGVMNILYDYMVHKIYNIPKSQEKFPELFL
jgi:dipeptide/tripeptide permease